MVDKNELTRWPVVDGNPGTGKMIPALFEVHPHDVLV